MTIYNESTLLFTILIVLLFAAVPLECNFCDTATEIDQKKREDAYVLTSPLQHPYAVLLLGMLSGKVSSTCSGSLLTERWTLTAAHCVEDNQFKYHVYAGGYSVKEVKTKQLPNCSQLLKVRDIIKHIDYDLALVKVKRKFKLTKFVNTVPFRVSPLTNDRPRDCTVTGYGRAQITGKFPSLDFIRKTQHLIVIQPCPCSFRIWQRFKPVRKLDKRNFICSVPREDYGICSGDSGSGFICDGVLVAVSTEIEIGINVNTCNPWSSDLPPCGRKNTLNMFTGIWARARWINSITHVYPDDTVFSGGSSTLTFSSIRSMKFTSVTACYLSLLLSF